MKCKINIIFKSEIKQIKKWIHYDYEKKMEN